MARRYFVQKKAPGRQSSSASLIFEKLIWGMFGLILLVLLLSVFWRHNSVDGGPDEVRKDNRFMGQIPQAPLELPEKSMDTGQAPQSSMVSPGAEPAPPQVPASGVEAPRVTPNSGTGQIEGAAAGGPQGAAAPAAATGVVATVQPEPKPATQTEPGSNSAAVRPTPPASSPPASPPAPAPPTATQAPYVVRVGAFKSQANAQEMCDRLKKLGYVTQIWEHSHGQLGRLFMVELAPFDNKSKALKVKAEVEKQEHLEAKLITRN